MTIYNSVFLFTSLSYGTSVLLIGWHEWYPGYNIIF